MTNTNREMVKMEFLVYIVLVLFWFLEETASEGGKIAKEGCIDRCGNVNIPYPFGIGSNCYANQSFSIACNNSKPFLTALNDLEVLYINMYHSSQTIQVNFPIAKSDDCPTHRTINPHVNLSGTPFSYSYSSNLFFGIGCNMVAQILTEGGTTAIAQCTTVCNKDSTPNNNLMSWEKYFKCYGVNCCQTSIPPSLKFVNVSLASINTGNKSRCNYGFLVDRNWLSQNLSGPYEVEAMESVPVSLDWETDENCYGNLLYDKRCYCNNMGNEESKVNPYLQNGCPVFAHTKYCAGLTERYCERFRDGAHCSYRCITNSNRTVKFIFVGLGSGLGGLFMFMGAWRVRKNIKRRNKAKLKKKFFKLNGGLLLQQQLSTAEQGYSEKTKLFTSKDLETATDRYNENRVLGHGGQGTVYKGMLTDGKIVAVKKSIKMDEGKVKEFINEVVILSQINHRNVVKLHGCCLETEVPLLVYDFIQNGTLFQYIHDQENENFPLTWDVRLRIASEVAGALSYLHSAASLPIYHRDIKSSNILLDDKYRAKVADFGTSRSAAVDQTHMTTRVHGTIGYLDPEYYQSSQYTAKSDVYSFGVVLVELLTGQKAVLPITFMEGRSLATYFMLSMRENRLIDILDAQVLREGTEGEIVGVAYLANRCLNLNGRKRPTMKEVSSELEVIKNTHGASPHFQVQLDEEVDDNDITQLAGPFDSTASTSITSLVGR